MIEFVLPLLGWVAVSLMFGGLIVAVAENTRRRELARRRHRDAARRLARLRVGGDA